MKIEVCPFVLNCDQMHFADQLNVIDGIDEMHLDIMDNHFASNLTWGLSTAQTVVKSTTLPVDVHLMIDNPDRWAPEYAKAGCSIVGFRFEAAKAPLRTAEAIRELGTKPGIALNPTTPVNVLVDTLPRFGQVLLVGVEPEFGGWGFVPEVHPKIKWLRKMIEEARLDTDIEVGGGVSDKNIVKVAGAGADVIAASFLVFKHEPARTIARLREIAVGVCWGTPTAGFALQSRVFQQFIV